MSNVRILAIESSCDETAAAVVSDGDKVLSNIVSSQIDTHKAFGGVIPEVASRMHAEVISTVINQALTEASCTMNEIDAVAFTRGPGLIGCLHVGAQAAKTLAWYYHKPLIDVQHIAGHIYANQFIEPLVFPLLALVVSGGHTELVYMADHLDFRVLGQTQDDAVGECYDKVARVMNLGYPGGPKIDKLAAQGSHRYSLPTVHTQGRYDFSFSGLKSAVIQCVQREQRNGQAVVEADLAYDIQHAAVAQLIDKTTKALQDYPVHQCLLGGGVAANKQLRSSFEQLSTIFPDVRFRIPPMWCCTDNAAMIGAAAYPLYLRHHFVDLNIGADASLDLDWLESVH